MRTLAAPNSTKEQEIASACSIEKPNRKIWIQFAGSPFYTSKTADFQLVITRGAYLLNGNASLRIGFSTFGAGVQSLLLCIGPLNLYLVFKLILLRVIHFKFYWNTSSSNFLRKHTWEIYF